MILVTVGTGIGGGIIIGGNLYGGFNSAAGEIGHMTIVYGGRECSCGRRGCWERYASAQSLARDAREIMRVDGTSRMWEFCGGDIGLVTAKTPFDAARAGDREAERLVDGYISYLACGVTNLVNVFQPQLVCIGGGISNEPDEWVLSPLRERVLSGMYPHGRARTAVDKARLGDRAGVVGAAILCRDGRRRTQSGGVRPSWRCGNSV
jgi:glucokinase